MVPDTIWNQKVCERLIIDENIFKLVRWFVKRVQKQAQHTLLFTTSHVTSRNFTANLLRRFK